MATDVSKMWVPEGMEMSTSETLGRARKQGDPERRPEGKSGRGLGNKGILSFCVLLVTLVICCFLIIF